MRSLPWKLFCIYIHIQLLPPVIQVVWKFLYIAEIIIHNATFSVFRGAIVPVNVQPTIVPARERLRIVQKTVTVKRQSA